MRDARQAIDWYIEVFGARPRGDVYEGSDGSIGHAELAIGDAVLMLSIPWLEGGVDAPEPGRPHSHSLHLQVDDVDGTVRRAADEGAEIERQPEDQPYGRVATLLDPFGHRWMLNQPPRSASRVAHGDIGYVTLSVPDDERAKAFYGAVLGWEFTPGHVARGWQIEGRTPQMGLHGERRAVRVGRPCATASRTWAPPSSGCGRLAARPTIPNRSPTACSPTAPTTRASSSNSGNRPTDPTQLCVSVHARRGLTRLHRGLGWPQLTAKTATNSAAPTSTIVGPDCTSRW